MGGPRSSDDSSSGEEDGPAEWKAALNSIVATTTFGAANGFSTSKRNAKTINTVDGDDDNQFEPQKLKHYQIKVISHHFSVHSS